MRRFPTIRTAPLFAALVIAGALAQPASAMDVMQQRESTFGRLSENATFGSSFFLALASTVADAKMLNVLFQNGARRLLPEPG